MAFWFENPTLKALALLACQFPGKAGALFAKPPAAAWSLLGHDLSKITANFL